MYLLDTDVLIWVLRGHQSIVSWVSQTKETSPVSISVISIAEIYKHIFPIELTATENLLNHHIILDVDQHIAKAAGLYWQHYSKKLKTLSLADCLIAATANIHNLILVSLNTKHFPMTDIQVINPLS